MPHNQGESRQTCLGQPAAKKHGTASAGLMREYGLRLEKARKSLPTVARLQAGRSSRASLRVNPQTPGSPPASAAPRRDVYGVVGCRDMQAASKHGFWARTSLHGSGMAITPWQPAPDMAASSLKRRPHGTVPGQFSANLRASHGSGIASATVKISHKVLPAPKIHITNMLQSLTVIHLINQVQFIAYHGMRPSE